MFPFRVHEIEMLVLRATSQRSGEDARGQGENRNHHEIAFVTVALSLPDRHDCTCEAKVGASFRVAKSSTDKQMIAPFLRYRRRPRRSDAAASS